MSYKTAIVMRARSDREILIVLGLTKNEKNAHKYLEHLGLEQVIGTYSIPETDQEFMVTPAQSLREFKKFIGRYEIEGRKSNALI